MRELLGAARYTLCPVCQTRYPAPAMLNQSTARLLPVDEGDAPGFWDRGVVFCGNCGVGFRPDIGHGADSTKLDVACDVTFVRTERRTGELRRTDGISTIDVPCEASTSWLRFRAASHRTHAGEFVFIDVMSAGGDDDSSTERKLCGLIVTREDLLRALEIVKPRSDP